MIVHFAFLVVLTMLPWSASVTRHYRNNNWASDSGPSSEPTFSPTYPSSVEFQYQQDLIGVSPDEFSSHPLCSDVFRAAVAAVMGASTEASAVNVPMVDEVSDYSTDQVRVKYTSSFEYFGDHEEFLDIADECNQAFVEGVESGNFTSELQRLAVEAGESLLYNVTSSSVLMLDFDHIYESPSPTVVPSQSPGATQFYEQPWFTYALNVVIVCAVTGVIFAIGFYWKATAHHIHSICVEPPDEKYVESSSDSDAEAGDDDVYKFQVDPNIRDVDDMY